jgi:hypothetical protein
MRRRKEQRGQPRRFEKEGEGNVEGKKRKREGNEYERIG